jgi:Cu/Ag efflux protein CusF
MTRRSALLFTFMLALTGCARKPETKGKEYVLRGEIKSLDSAGKMATIKHEKIDGWMEAMTMDFPVKPDAEFLKLHVGDRVTGKVVVSDLSYYVTDLKIQR